MHWFRMLWWRVEVLFRKASAEDELDEELRYHLESEIQSNVHDGMTPQEARRKALVEFGGVERTKEQVRDVRGARSLDDLGQDLRLAARRLRKSPGFAATAAFILALGIGTTVAMFSVLDAALLRALPLPEPHRLVLGRATFSGRVNETCSFPDYLDYRDGTDAFESLAAMIPGFQRNTVTGGDAPERVNTNWVTVNFFQVLDVATQMGRTFMPEEAEASAPGVVMVSHGFWQRWFGGDPDVLGRTVIVAGMPRTVVGVMPPGFRYRDNVDLWLPVVDGTMDTRGRRSHSWQIVGRLRSGLTLAQAQAQVNVISSQLTEAYPESHTEKGLLLSPLHEAFAEGYRPALLVLLGATGLLLLIACGNVAGLLVARATSRKVELSVRSALGATRPRILRQLLTESLLLAGMAGCFGTFLAVWFQGLMLGFVPLEEMGIWDVGVSWGMLAFALALSLGTAVLFGAGPALTASQANPAEELKGGRRASAAGKSNRVRGGLVAAQVALSVILLTGSGLLLRSFVRLQGVDVGFETENVVTGSLAISSGKYEDVPSRARFFRGVQEDVEAVPGVVSASFIDMVPIRHRWRNWFIWDTNNPPEEQEGRVSTFSRTVFPGYFETMGIPVLQGRDHLDEDEVREEPYLILSESAARATFPDQDPIGRQVSVFNAMDEATYEVLGVVADIRMTELAQSPLPQMYYNYPTRGSTYMNLVVRAQGEVGGLVASIRQAVSDRDPDVPFSDVSTMTEIISDSLSPNRILSVATGLFAVTALLLSLTGLYAVLAYYVARRTQEIGIRVAFGATGKHVLGLVLGKGLTLVGVGLVLGLLGAGAVSRILQSQLYEVGATDPVTFGGVAVGFLLVGILASLAPARRATRVDPVRAIQAE